MPDFYYIRTDKDEFLAFDGHEGEYFYASLITYAGAAVFLFTILDDVRRHLTSTRGWKGIPSIYRLGDTAPIETYQPPLLDDDYGL